MQPDELNIQHCLGSFLTPEFNSPSQITPILIATHASVKKVVTCSRWMAILSQKDKNNNNYFLKKPNNEKKTSNILK
jgi:hypothetical protein